MPSFRKFSELLQEFKQLYDNLNAKYETRSEDKPEELNFENLSAINIYKNTSQEDDSSPYKSIAIYLAEQIATKPKEKVFNEEFSFAGAKKHPIQKTDRGK